MVTMVKNKFQAKLELNLKPLLFSSWEISKQLKDNVKSKKQKRACGDTAKPEANRKYSSGPKSINEYDICT